MIFAKGGKAQRFAAPSSEGSVIEVIPGTCREAAPAEGAGRTGGAVPGCGAARASGAGPGGSVVGDVRAVFAENAKLRAENQRLKGEVAILRNRLGGSL
ncbi:MAG: hypothetical protein IJ087_00345 [Eggerthellaceae bacterium]|nr:hypothetical protein [Eggerthellaceae bacterium]